MAAVFSVLVRRAAPVTVKHKLGLRWLCSAYKFQVLVIRNGLSADEAVTRNQRVGNQYAAPKFSHVPSCFGIVGVAKRRSCYSFYLSRLAVEQHVITAPYLLSGPILQRGHARQWYVNWRNQALAQACALSSPFQQPLR
jgi:hypothetical protein